MAKGRRSRAAAARKRTVDTVNAMQALDRLNERRREIIVEKRQLVETLERLEYQHEEWSQTIRVLRKQRERLDVEIISLTEEELAVMMKEKFDG